MEKKLIFVGILLSAQVVCVASILYITICLTLAYNNMYEMIKLQYIILTTPFAILHLIYIFKCIIAFFIKK